MFTAKGFMHICATDTFSLLDISIVLVLYKNVMFWKKNPSQNVAFLLQNRGSRT
jgi:hypothetical protein